jgi:Zn ribbon nucleic-acid-binding protein
MIRSATPTVPDEFAGLKWTDHFEPVSAAAQRTVSEATTRVTLREPPRGRAKKLTRITADEIRMPSERVLQIMECVAPGMSDTSIANKEGIRREAVAHVFRVLRIPKRRVSRPKDESRDGIFVYLVQMGRVEV